MVRVGIIHNVCNCLEHVLWHAPLPLGQLDQIDAELTELDIIADCQQALLGDRCFLASHFLAQEQSRDKSPPTPTPTVKRLDMPFTWISGLLDRNVAYHLDTLDTCIEILAEPNSQRLKSIKDLTAQFQGQYFLRIFLRGEFFSRGEISRISTRIDTATWLTVRLQVIRAALALERSRIVTGLLPVSLDNWTAIEAKLFVDPFSNELLIYKKTPAGFIIYSIGPNGLDDQGRDRSVNRQQYDIPFSINRS
jgi:hypothetical protein